MTVTRIYVHAASIQIASNKNTVADRPIMVKPEQGTELRANRVRLTGPSVIIYDPAANVGLGARCWIETYSPVEVLD